MNRRRSVFAQLLGVVPFGHCERLVDRFAFNRSVKHFSPRSHLLCMMYSQFTRREGLRGLAPCRNSQRSKLYHIGMCGKISRSTLANANERRGWQLFKALGHRRIAVAVEPYFGQDSGLGLEEPQYAMHSKTCVRHCSRGRTPLDHSGGGAHYHRSARRHRRLCACHQRQGARRQCPGSDLLSRRFDRRHGAIAIAKIYCKRGQVGTFFKWIKLNVSIKHFFGKSINVVTSQIQIAVCIYLIAMIS